MLVVRPARINDVEAIKAIDHIAPIDDGRVNYIRTAVADGRTHILLLQGDAIGYGIIEHHFFGHTFIELVYLREDVRENGYGPFLMKSLESMAVTEKIFTSTNRSNERMRHVLEREGWQESGTIDNLDEGDPEIVYCKMASTI